MNPQKNRNWQGTPGYVPGHVDVNTTKQFLPNNVANRPNDLMGDGVDLGNGLGSYPKTFNAGFQTAQEELRIMAESFEPSIFETRYYNYRQIFNFDTIPRSKGTHVKQYARTTNMDDNPQTAPVLNYMNSWTPEWNEVSISAMATEATINMYGRYFKNHEAVDEIFLYDWKLEMTKKFADNAMRTLNKLAAIRMWQGANKLYVTSVANFDPADPFKARITLGAKLDDVKAPLTLDALLEAKYLMTNYIELYTTVNSTTGALKNDNQRLAKIPGYRGTGAYLVLLSDMGYNQVWNNEYFRTTYIQNGGVMAGQSISQTTGITTSIFGLKFEICDQPLTLNVVDQKTVVDTNGMGTWHVAFVVGGAMHTRIGVELNREGSTKLISISKDEDKKIDPFSLLSLVGWVTMTDFTIIQNECLWAIPHKKTINIAAGAPQRNPGTWKA